MILHATAAKQQHGKECRRDGKEPIAGSPLCCYRGARLPEWQRLVAEDPLGNDVNTITLGTTRFACVDRGQGAPVMLVHGSNSDYRTWDGVADGLRERFRTIAYSRRYHWPNQRIQEGVDYSMQEHVADLEALVHALEVAPVHLVGHSYGGFLCLLLAMRRPGLVRSLVLVEPPVLTLFTSPKPRPREIAKLLLTRPRTAIAIAKFGMTGLAPAIAALKRGDSSGALARVGAAVLGRDHFRGLSNERREQTLLNFVPAELLGSGFSPLDEEQVRSVGCPVLLINGQLSPGLFRHLTARLRELIPHAQHVEIPQASHIVHEDNPVQWKATVRPFLAKHS